MRIKKIEMYNRLKEFAEYLDNMESGKEKAKLANIFIGYNETLKAYLLEEAKYSIQFENYRRKNENN